MKSGNGRSLAWLSLAVLALAGAHIWLAGDGVADRTVALDTRLLPMADDADEIVLVRSGAAPLRLVRESGWRLAEPVATDVKDSVVSRLVDALAFGSADDSMSESDLLRLGRTLPDFFRADRTNAVFVVSGGRTNILDIGERLPAGDGVYAMVDGKSPVLVVSTDLVAAVDCPLAALRDDALFAIPADAVSAFDVKRAAGDFLHFARTADGWTLTGARTGTVSANRVATFLEGILSASAVSFAWPTGAPGESRTADASLLSGFGLDAELSTGIAFHTQDGRDASIRFGKAAFDGTRYALVRGGASVVTVGETLYAAVLLGADELVDLRLWPMEEGAVAALSIADGAVGYLLARDADGAWHFDAPVSAPADAAHVGEIVARLLRLTKADVGETGLAVSLTTNLPPVRLAREKVLGPIRFEDLRSRRIVRIAPESVRRLASDATSVVRDPETRAWNVERGDDGVADAAAVKDVLAALDPLEAASVVALNPPVEDYAAYGLDHPRFTLSVDSTEAGVLRKNILIGRETETGSYATLGASDAVFFLNRETVLRLTAPLVTKE